jgi:hypothetical protein
MKRHVFTLAAVVLTACAAAVVRAAADPAAVQGRVAAVSARQAQIVPALARDQRPEEAIDSGDAGPYAANPGLARRIDTQAGPAWVVPADGHVCLRATDGADPVWTCVSDEDTASGNLLLTLRDGDGALLAVYGVVPAGASDARLTGVGSVTTVDGVFGVDGVDADAVLFTDDEGNQAKVALP